MDRIRAAKRKNQEFDEFMKELKGGSKDETIEEEEEPLKEVKPENVLNSLDIAKKIALDLNL